MALNPSAAHYALRYWLTDIEFDDSTDSAVRSRIYAALQRSGMDLACPQQNETFARSQSKSAINEIIRTT
jgi:small-conductance mechanosensitive channel